MAATAKAISRLTPRCLNDWHLNGLPLNPFDRLSLRPIANHLHTDRHIAADLVWPILGNLDARFIWHGSPLVNLLEKSLFMLACGFFLRVAFIIIEGQSEEKLEKSKG